MSKEFCSQGGRAGFGRIEVDVAKAATDRVKVKVIRSGVARSRSEVLSVQLHKPDRRRLRRDHRFQRASGSACADIAKQEGVDIRSTRHYKVEEEIRAAMSACSKRSRGEDFGKAPYARSSVYRRPVGRRCMVIDGLIVATHARVYRDGFVSWEGNMLVRRFKDMFGSSEGSNAVSVWKTSYDVKVGDQMGICRRGVAAPNCSYATDGTSCRVLRDEFRRLWFELEIASDCGAVTTSGFFGQKNGSCLRHDPR